ncbi:MAG: ArsR/SmtB family transcription factor [Candidatus Syntropharchaeia archaeon]
MSVIPPSYDISSETLEKIRNLAKEDASHITSIFKVLSDPVRIKILRALEVEKLCVCVFVEVMNYRYSALSYHLKLLKKENLVNFRREGNFLIYELTDLGKKILELVEEIEELLKGKVSP